MIAADRPTARCTAPVAAALAALLSVCLVSCSAPEPRWTLSTAQTITTQPAPAASAAPARPSGAPDGPVVILDGQPTPLAQVNPTPIPAGDPRVVDHIIDESANRSQVMDHLRYLSEHGPRLTGSSRLENAQRWAADQFRAWGLTNVHLEPWGTIPVRFDRGESWGKVVVKNPAPPTPSDAKALETAKKEQAGVKVNAEKVQDAAKNQTPPPWKTVRDLAITTLAWTRGTSDGKPVQGPVVRMPDSPEQYEKIKDRLDGAWVLVPPPAEGGRGPRGPGQLAGERYRQRRDARAKLATFKDSGSPLPADLSPDELVLTHSILGFITSSRDERVWTTSCPGWRDLAANGSDIPPDLEVMVRLSDYDYMNSRLADGEEFQVEIRADNQLIPGPHQVYNVVADIPGRSRPDEFVIVSAHSDSWDGPGSQGTTDNGTGSSVTLEAARLLMACGAKPERTIRFILWSGEEQGLLGSRAYVKAHPELLPRISGVFVDDGGTNSEGGLLCSRDMVPLLAAATSPVNFRFLDDVTGEPLNVNLRAQDDFKPHGGSDHFSFFEAGVPAFFWDEVGRADYGEGWHTQNDRLNLAIPAYLRQSAACAAITSYNLACAPDLLPRWRTDTGVKLEPPSYVSASDGAYPDYILVNWAGVAAADSYDLFRSRSKDAKDLEKIATATDRTNFEDRSAEPGVMYYYWVDARPPVGSALSPARSAEPAAGFRARPPLPPNLHADSDTCGGVTLTWDAVDGIKAYEIYTSPYMRVDADAVIAEGSTSSSLLATIPAGKDSPHTWRDERKPGDLGARSYLVRCVGPHGPGPAAKAWSGAKACP